MSQEGIVSFYQSMVQTALNHPGTNSGFDYEELVGKNRTSLSFNCPLKKRDFTYFDKIYMYNITETVHKLFLSQLLSRTSGVAPGYCGRYKPRSSAGHNNNNTSKQEK